MALNECERCTTAFAVGLERCPHCQSTEYHEQGGAMPKNTVSTGPSYEETAADALAAETGGDSEYQAAKDRVDSGEGTAEDRAMVDRVDGQRTAAAERDGGDAEYRDALARRDAGSATPEDVALIQRYERDQTDAASESGDRYDDMTKEDLQDELRGRRDADGKQLKVSGNVDELKARLRDHDQTGA